MTYETIICEVEGKVGTITLNRPKTLNAINAKLCDELETVIAAIEVAPEPATVILAGSEKCFGLVMSS